MRGQLKGLVDDTVGHGDAERGSARLNLVLASLEQHLVVPLQALLLLLLRCHKPGDTWLLGPAQGTAACTLTLAFTFRADTFFPKRLTSTFVKRK